MMSRQVPDDAAPSATTALGGGVLAAVAAGIAMAVFRTLAQVRTVPERLMEWLLLFVPLDLFEAGLRRFGFDAKRYALAGAFMVMFAMLAGLGAYVLRRRWPVSWLLALGVGLWLFVMVVIMPLTSAGFFALGLIHGVKAAFAGYFSIAMSYAVTLALVRLALSGAHAVPEPATTLARLAPRGSNPRPASSSTSAGGTGGMKGFRHHVLDTGQAARVLPPALARTVATPRRTAATLASGLAATYLGSFLLIHFGPKSSLTRVIVADPQQPVPSGGIEPPNPHPNLVSTPSVQPAAGRAAATAAGSFEPPPPRQIPRDKDGAALAAGRRKGQLATAITSNDDFYVVTKNAGGDPVIRLNEWRLRIDGEVERPVEIDYQNLRRLPAVELVKTLECISNFAARCELAPFGCDLISTARWKGVRVADVLALAGGIKSSAVSLATFGADEYTTALPINVALDPDTVLAYEMNGQVLPREHGYPLRMLVPGRYGMKNAKWVVALRVLPREFVDWYGQRNWSRDAIVKTMTRIDVPAMGADLPPGEARIAGIAYAGDRGISRVEFSTDGGGRWQEAELLEPPLGRDTWVRWQGRFMAPPGAELTLMARATDGTGALQPEPFTLPQPDGSSGWCSVQVKVARA